MKRDAVETKTRRVAEGWPESMLYIMPPETDRRPYDNQDWMTPESKMIYAGLQISRHVRDELSRVYLRVMHTLAMVTQGWTKNTPGGGAL